MTISSIQIIITQIFPKVRLWTLQAQVPRVPPLALCAIALPPSRVDMDYLLSPLIDLLLGLMKEGINVVSYSCDGAEVERKLQRALASKADTYVTYPFIDPVDRNVFEINIPLFNGHPLVMMQDSKHLLKTF